MSKETIPLRKDVPAEYKWDLSSIYKSDDEWEADLKAIPAATEKLASYKGRLGESKEVLLEALQADQALDMLLENVYHYANLINESDQSDSKAQDMVNRAMMAYTQAGAASSFYVPELLSIPDDKINTWIEGDEFKDFKIYVKKLLHTKPYVLSEKEEKLLALQSESGQTASSAFSLLNDVDMNFGTVKVDG